MQTQYKQEIKQEKNTTICQTIVKSSEAWLAYDIVTFRTLQNFDNYSKVFVIIVVTIITECIASAICRACFPAFVLLLIIRFGLVFGQRCICTCSVFFHTTQVLCVQTFFAEREWNMTAAALERNRQERRRTSSDSCLARYGMSVSV